MIDNSNNLVELTASPFSFEPNDVVGYRRDGRPIYNIAGGSGEVSVGVDNDDDDDDDTEVEASEEVEDDWTPPSREEWEKLKQAKSKADSESAARKRFLREAGIDPKTGKPISKPKFELEDDEDEEEDETAEAQETAVKQVKGESKGRSNKNFQRQLEREIAKTERRVRDEATTLLSAVPTALEDAGWNGKNLERMIKLLDLDEIQVDSDGEIDGLSEQIDELKELLPEYFKRKRMKEAVKEVADTKTVGGGAKKAPASETNLDWTNRLKQQLYGN